MPPNYNTFLYFLFSASKLQPLHFHFLLLITTPSFNQIPILYTPTPLKYNTPLTIPHYDPPFTNSQLLPRKYNPPFNYSHFLPPNYIPPLNNSHFLPLN